MSAPNDYFFLFLFLLKLFAACLSLRDAMHLVQPAHLPPLCDTCLTQPRSCPPRPISASLGLPLERPTEMRVAVSLACVSGGPVLGAPSGNERVNQWKTASGAPSVEHTDGFSAFITALALSR